MDVNREQFDAALAELFGALDRPFSQAKADGFWKGLERMTWVQFCRVRDHILRELEHGEPPRTLSVSTVWATHRGFRAHAPAVPIETPWAGDEWDRRANLLLLVYIRTRTPEQLRAYGRPAGFKVLRASLEDLNKLGLDHHNLDASAEFVRRVEWLVKFKNAWARDMREWGSMPTAEQQRSNWDECMRRAEAA